MISAMENTSLEEIMGSIAKIYGISLEDIEVVHLSNGKKYFKFYDSQDRTIKMIENKIDAKQLIQQFQEIQETIFSLKKEKKNLDVCAVLDYQLCTQNIELFLISVPDFKNNRSSYHDLFDKLSPEGEKCICVLLENIDFLELEYINVENAIGIDYKGRVIYVDHPYDTGKCELKIAEPSNNQHKKEVLNDIGFSFPKEEEFDSLVANMDVSSVLEDKLIMSPITICGKNINMVFALQAFQYPEIIERSGMSEFDKGIYYNIIRAIHRKIERINSKQYTFDSNQMQNHSQIALVNSIPLALLAGFFGGMILVVAFHVMRHLF